MNVCLLAVWSDSLTYTVTRALTFCGHTVQVRLVDVARDRGSQWSLSQRIDALDQASVVADEQARAPVAIDCLIVQGHPLLFKHHAALNQLAPLAKHIIAISAGDRSRPYKQALVLQWREWRWYRRWFGKVQRIAYKDGFYPLDWLGTLRSRRVIGFDAHSKFLQDDELFAAIHAQDWACDTPRPFRANFVGSRDPATRGRILDIVEPSFSVGAAGEGRQGMVWRAYSDAQPAALSAKDFLRVLTDSDFTLSPPGFSLVTHRPVEALLRGSIPVLNAQELGLYDVGLADGVNCIAVPPNGWRAAMQRIVDMGAPEIAQMRRNILAMVPHRVAYPALAQHMAKRLGLADTAVRRVG